MPQQSEPLTKRGSGEKMRTILERNVEYFKTAKEKTSRKPHQLFVLALYGGIFSAFGSIGFAFGCFYGGSRLIGALLSQWVSF